MLCPSVMAPASKDIKLLNQPRETPLQASVDVLPHWKPSYFSSVSFVGTFLSIMGNAPSYNIKMDDCAELVAADFGEARREICEEGSWGY